MNQSFVTKLKVYSDFGIKMTRTEINSLLKTNEGNPVGLRALAHVIEQTKTPYKLNFRDISSLEDDLMKIERLAAHAMYTPMEYHTQAIEIFRNTRVISVRDDNSVYETGSTYDSVALLIERSAFESFVESIDQMSNAWIADVTTPSISRVSAAEIEQQKEINEALRQQGIEEKYLDNIEEPESTTSVESDPGIVLTSQNNARYKDAIRDFVK